MSSHLEVDQLSTAVTDEKEDVDGLEGQGLDDEEVGGRDRLSVVGEEGPPSSGSGDWNGGADDSFGSIGR
jgi:hypothetical protein